VAQNWLKLKVLWGLLAATLLMVGAAACGGGTKSASSTSNGLLARGAPTKPASISRLRPRHAIGDYDTDDYEVGGDADDDDSTGRTDRDGDSDNSSGGLYDSDDTNLLSYSHFAGAAETRVVALLVRRYLAAAAATDGATACSMVLASLAKTVPTVLGGVGEPPYSRGRTCAEVLAKIFRFYRGQLSIEARVLRVLRVGVKGNKGLAVLTAKAKSGVPDRVIALQREGGAWKIDGILDQEQP
jgi:hypothetical protein